MNAIESIGLTKRFRELTALDELTLEVHEGELFGLVGPDGAGKTTTMRLLCGIMDPTSGEASVAGHSILKEPERIKEKIGYMSQRFGLYGDLTVLENILFYADLFNVPKRELSKRIERLLGFSNLTPFKDRLAQNLSGGMKQKLGLACALIHTPEILFLDEPTFGVDPISRGEFWQILYGLLKEGVTIFVSTAYMDEAERCHRVGLLHRGRLIACDEPDRLKLTTQEAFFEIRSRDRKRTKQVLDTLLIVKGTSLFGDSIHIKLETQEKLDELLLGLKEMGIEAEAREIAPSLEDIFISMTQSKVGTEVEAHGS
ncbi:MAG: multidrug ABC transporter ATP-binding protein [Deltaproteobacteria bacterium RBG_16_47_11]|nr:MAG: multidrug ABC transporter ATP-binding protein [Deltaproteobacteria bacterium RBG_16_47_11]